MSGEREGLLGERTTRIGTGVLLIAVPLGFMAFFTMLQVRFDYPDILRKPGGEVLVRFAEQRGEILPLWYGMFASATLFIPLSVVAGSLCVMHRGAGTALAVLGTAAGLVQAVGLSRWVFVVPGLASRYVASDSEQERATIVVVYEALNGLLGMGVGEHLGYALTAMWTIVLSISLPGTRRVTGLFGLLCGAGIGAGLLEPAGVTWAGGVNAVGYTCWSIWLVWLGVLCVRGGWKV